MIFPYGPAPAKIMIVADFPSEADAAAGRVLQGHAGAEFSQLLSKAKITQSQCFVTSVLRIPPPRDQKGNPDITLLMPEKKRDITLEHVIVNDRYVMPIVADHIEMLKQEIDLCKPHVILAVGNAALWALTGAWGITTWRGSVMLCTLQLNAETRPKVVPVHTPNAVQKMPEWRSITIHDMKRAARESTFPELRVPATNFITRPSMADVRSVLLQLITQVKSATSGAALAVDIETRNRHIACIGLAWNKTDALCIPLMCAERAEGYWTDIEEAEIVSLLRELLTHPNCHVIGQNFHYDSQYINRYWHFDPNVKHDTMLAQHSMIGDAPKSLDYLASLYCEIYCYWKDEGKEWNDKTGEDQLWVYNCKDAVATYEVYEEQCKAIPALGLSEVANFQQSLYFPVLKTMLRGIRVDEQKRGDYALMLLDEINVRQTKISELLGHPVNVKSPTQMAELFYNNFSCRIVRDRKTGNPTCNDEALNKIASREPLLRSLVRYILEERSLGVFYSTFVNAPLDVDRRLRCSFNIGGTETYRFSSSKNAFGTGLNFQNIPKGGVGDYDELIDDEEVALDLPNVRELFIPDPGHTFFDIDLSSADLRIVVGESGELEMKALLDAGLDPYTEFAKEYYHDPSITKASPKRQTFKGFAHGTHYLGSARGLAERFGLLVAEAEAAQKWYFGRFPNIKKWQDGLKDQVFKRGMVRNVFGYRRYFRGRINDETLREAAAWIPQSTVACLINRGYVQIAQSLPEVEILLQVHDSLAGQFQSFHGDWATREIAKACTIPLQYPAFEITIPVGIKTSKLSWGHCG
jgi:DNA polymerase I-like protein with 3'-5' exonuclease and polymerase domains/uracil-DNA glycosylase